MTIEQSNQAPLSDNLPAKPFSSNSTSTTSLTARLHIPTGYTSLPSQWLSSYRSFVRHNSSQVSSLESTLRSLTYLLPGTRFADTPLTSESLQTFLSLLTAYNTHLLAAPPWSPQRRYERFWETNSRLYARCSALLRTIQYTQLLLEMLAKRAGERSRWRLVVTLEAFKALCRLCMGRLSGSRPVIATGLGDDRTDRNPSSDPDPDPQQEPPNHHPTATADWTMPRTGMRLPPLPTTGGSDPITTFLSTRVLTADDIRPAPQLARTLSTLPAHLAETIYILRPLLHALALQRYRADKRDWRPWLLGLGLELAARQLSLSRARGRSGVEREEARRRGWDVAWWGMRGAFYERVTGVVVGGVAGRLKGVPVLDMLAVVVEDYDFLWREYYFPTATL